MVLGAIMNKKSNLTRLTVCAESELLDSVQQHRRLLLEQKGLRVSASSTISALIRAGLGWKRPALLKVNKFHLPPALAKLRSDRR